MQAATAHKTRRRKVPADIGEGKTAEARLRRSEAYLAEAQRLSHTGSAAYNETEILHWSDESSHIFGFDPLQGIPSREAKADMGCCTAYVCF